MLAEDNGLHAAYNKLLHHLFPPESDFEINPQWATPKADTDLVMVFFVTLRSSVVLILEIRPPGDRCYSSKRVTAEKQLRDWFLDTHSQIQIPVLHAISAFGTKIAFFQYHKDTRRVIPTCVLVEDPDALSDAAPLHWWDNELLQQAGANKFREVVAEVMDMAEDLGNADADVIPN